MRKSKMTKQKLERKILKRFEKIVKLCKKYDDIEFLSLCFNDGYLFAFNEGSKKICASKRFGEKEDFSI